MKNSVTRFTNRAESYAKYRPGYPAELLAILAVDGGLTDASIVADVGSGTGILAEMFLRNGNRVFGIEPNSPMREFAERDLAKFPRFVSIDATAEATTLEPDSLDFITAGQAFHWFDQAKAKREFKRILKPGGWVVLVWNERRLDASPFLRDYENLLLRYGTDYEKIRHENVAPDISSFYEPETYKLRSLDNAQHFDFEALMGRTRSSSYTPEPGDPSFDPMMSELEEIFRTRQRGGIVDFEYDTRIYYGHLTAES
ncbi:MAG TPA: class I SAM-dependent methyltransferase [Pyrinomonadaceae bacterium]|nr:class I SAM-dependent methyltransferase [Pyrinomonadaceae bacterium]